jgi:hypothetical protein
MSGPDRLQILRRVWLDFWFRESSPEVCALIRIALGAVGLIGLLSLMPVSAYWTLDGMVPAPGGGLGIREWIASAGLGTLAGWALFLMLVVSFGGMLSGILPQVTVPLAFAGSLLQGWWNPLPLAGSHRVLVSLLFCLMWIDSSRAFTLSVPPPVARFFASNSLGTTAIWPLRLMQIQIALIYLNSGFAKLMSEAWRSGTAVHYALHIDFLHRLPVGVSDFWPATAIATYVTLIWELAFALMLVNRWTRRLALTAGICLHVGMAVVLELGMFPWVMLAGYLAFLPPSSASRIVQMLRAAASGRPRDTEPVGSHSA